MENLKEQFALELTNKLVEKLSTEYMISSNISSRVIRLAQNDLVLVKECYASLSSSKFQSEHISVKELDDQYNLIFKDSEFLIEKKAFKKMLVHIIDVYNPILPLGTLVSLETKHLNKLTNGKKIEKALFVIIKRFIYTEDASVYFTYAGTPYPVGNLKAAEDFYFTENLVEEVMHTGYIDEQESTFTYMMKRELIIEKGYVSVGYASVEDRERLKFESRSD